MSNVLSGNHTNTNRDLTLKSHDVCEKWTHSIIIVIKLPIINVFHVVISPILIFKGLPKLQTDIVIAAFRYYSVYTTLFYMK